MKILEYSGKGDSMADSIVKFIDKNTNKILAITFDHDCTWHLVDFCEYCDDVEIEFYELEELDDKT